MIKQVAKGLLTFVPGLYQALRTQERDGTVSARYCYSVWMRHLVSSAQHSGITPSGVLLELGPGPSLGTGLAGLLSGCSSYIAIDALRLADPITNLRIFDELIEMFRAREPIPGPSEFPNINPALDDYRFPHQLLDDARLERSLESQRLEAIRAALAVLDAEGGLVQYRYPWSDLHLVASSSVDFAFSQAVLEHVSEPAQVYQALARWLKPGGTMSHNIDYRCHGSADSWNGHWRYSDLMWRMVLGKRPFLINRLPHSWHMGQIRENGFALQHQQTLNMSTDYPLSKVAPRFRSMTMEDLETRGAYVLAMKP